MSSKSNYFFNLVYTLLNTILPLLTAPYLSRVVGVEGIGTYAYYYAVAHYFFIFAKMGLNNYGTRQVSIVRRNRLMLNSTFSSIYFQQLITAGSASILYLLFCLLTQQKQENFTISLIMGITVFAGFVDVDWLYAGLELFRSIATKNIIIKIITVSLIFIVVKQPDDLWKYALLMALGIFGGYFSIWVSIRKYITFTRVQFSKVLSHFKPSIVLMLPVIAVNIYRFMSKVMLGSLSTMAETGYFENAEKIVFALCGFVTALGTVMMPKSANLVAAGRENDSMKYFDISLRFIMFLMCGMAFGLAAISSTLVVVIFGENFARSGPLLFGLSFTLIFIAWANVIRTQYVIPRKRDELYVGSVVAGAILNVILNFILIPSIGAFGAVIASISAELCVPLYLSVQLRKELPIYAYLKNNLLYVFSGILMFFCIRVLGNLGKVGAGLMLLIQILAGSFIYSLICFLYIRFFDKDLLESIRKIFHTHRVNSNLESNN